MWIIIMAVWVSQYQVRRILLVEYLHVPTCFVLPLAAVSNQIADFQRGMLSLPPQANRVKWGETGDALTANFPKGQE